MTHNSDLDPLAHLLPAVNALAGRSIGSLFSGIGGLELGLERAGLGPVVWQVEIDPFCRNVLAAHWPNAQRFEDVKTVGAHNLPRVDIICGGFPCQDVSLAGKGAGLKEGTRTGLWFEFARIVRELKPAFVVAENVPGLIRRGLDIVVTDLADAGYTVEATRIRAEDFGAPHRRERLFIVAHRDGARLRDEPGWSGGSGWAGAGIAEHEGAELADTNGSGRQKWQAKPGPARETSVDHASLHICDEYCEHVADVSEQYRRINGREASEPGWCNSWPPTPTDMRAWRTVQADSQPSVCRLADGFSAQLARRSAKLKALGNAVVPACAEIIGRRVMELIAKSPAIQQEQRPTVSGKAVTQQPRAEPEYDQKTEEVAPALEEVLNGVAMAESLAELDTITAYADRLKGDDLKAASATPPAFRDLLISIAEGCNS